MSSRVVVAIALLAALLAAALLAAVLAIALLVAGRDIDRGRCLVPAPRAPGACDLWQYPAGRTPAVTYTQAREA